MASPALIVLAAGMGTRMKSALPKVLHRAAGRSLLGHALTAANRLAPERTIVVTGPDMEGVGAETLRFSPQAALVTQVERKGTGHAVLQALGALGGFAGPVVVLYGDVPLIEAETLQRLIRLVDGRVRL